LLVVPSQHLLAVWTHNAAIADEVLWTDVERTFFDPLMGALLPADR
jgi:hypothetical protein